MQLAGALEHGWEIFRWRNITNSSRKLGYWEVNIRLSESSWIPEVVTCYPGCVATC